MRISKKQLQKIIREELLKEVEERSQQQPAKMQPLDTTSAYNLFRDQLSNDIKDLSIKDDERAWLVRTIQRLIQLGKAPGNLLTRKNAIMFVDKALGLFGEEEQLPAWDPKAEVARNIASGLPGEFWALDKNPNQADFDAGVEYFEKNIEDRLHRRRVGLPHHYYKKMQDELEQLKSGEPQAQTGETPPESGPQSYSWWAGVESALLQRTTPPGDLK